MKCDDQKFAFTLLDGQMMQWLLDADAFDRVEVVGPWVLLAASRLDPSAWLDLGTWLDEFHTPHPAGRVLDVSAPVRHLRSCRACRSSSLDRRRWSSSCSA